VRSSTSNSDIHLTRRYIPGGPWLGPLVVALLLTLLTIGAEEYALARRGFAPTIVDSASIWARERARAGRLGSDALVLIGSSRMQLDVDLDTLRDMTGKEPVQLAIDGSSFVSVLADLAADDSVTGTVLVDYQDHVVNDLHRDDGAAVYLAQWQRVRGRSAIPDFTMVESWLGDQLHRRLRSFADGASPFHSLAMRVFEPDITPQYLVTLPSRERRADYRRVEMPQFYYDRASRNAGFTDAPPKAQDRAAFDAEVKRRIGTLQPVNLPHFGANSTVIAGMVRRIEARGGHVVFIMFPRSGLVREADERRFPRAVYWERFIRTVRAPNLYYADVPALASFICPDGAHLDAREQVPFTRDLVNALAMLRDAPQAPDHPMAAAPTGAGPKLEQVR
jgi:hypothetical protein